MALIHRKTNSSEPLWPKLGQRFKPGGGGSARRALSSLGSSNRSANLRLAESLLTISASEFLSKWNFDPLKETPLPQGQFLWTPVKPTTSKVPIKVTTAGATRPNIATRPNTKAECDLAACFKLPQKEVVTRLNDGDSVQLEVQTCLVSDVGVQSVRQTSKVSVKPDNQIYRVSVQPVDKKCKEPKCLSVISNTYSKINKSRNITSNVPLCTDVENNNFLTPVGISRNKRQSNITDFLRPSKRPMSSSVSCEAPKGTSAMVSLSETTILSPSKKQRITSNGNTL